MRRCLWPVLVVLVLSVLALAVANTSAPGSSTASLSLQTREQKVWKGLTRSTEFADVPHLSYARCEAVSLPQALATPDPFLVPTARSRRVKVSFIIGTDGHVHAPLILESAGPRGDRSVLKTVKTWKYRPGTCNGVPTETEGKIEFSVQ